MCVVLLFNHILSPPVKVLTNTITPTGNEDIDFILDKLKNKVISTIIKKVYKSLPSYKDPYSVVTLSPPTTDKRAYVQDPVKMLYIPAYII